MDNDNLYIWLRDDMDMPSDPRDYRIVEVEGLYHVQRYDRELGWADLCEEIHIVQPITFDSHDAAQLFLQSNYGENDK